MKKSLLQVLLDTIEEAVRSRFNPSGYRDAAMEIEDNTRRQKAIMLIEILSKSAISGRQRKSFIERIGKIRSDSAFPDLRRYFDKAVL